MNKLLIPSAILCFCIGIASAQSNGNSKEPEYLINLTETKLSGFGNTHHEVSFIDGKPAYTSGIAGAFLFNYKFYTGIYSISLESRHMVDDIYPSDHQPDVNESDPLYINNRICFNHGGLMIGYIYNPNNLWHLNTNIKFGRGRIALMDRHFDFTDFEQHHRDWVGVITPEIDMEINLARWCKFGMSLGYRFVLGVDEKHYTNINGESQRLFSSSQFSSPVASIKFHFGSFGPKNGRNGNNGNNNYSF